MAGRIKMFEKTATGILGEKRDTMLENELLLRSSTGKQFERGYSPFPRDPRGFGRSYDNPDGGVKAAISHWNSVALKPKLGRDLSDKRERDFVALNRAAIDAGLVTGPEQYQFRATNDPHRKDTADKLEAVHRSVPERPNSSMVFGMPTRPTTPMADLLENRYQTMWLANRRNVELENHRQAGLKSKAAMIVQHTHSSHLKTYQEPVTTTKQLWHMPRFSRNSKPALKTFYIKGARDAAFEHYKSDRIARMGMKGQGTYTVAQN